MFAIVVLGSFAADAAAIATKADRHVAETATIADGKTKLNVAILEQNGKHELKNGAMGCANDNACQSAYLIERPAKAGYWLVEYTDDWLPTTITIKADRIYHEQLHIGGTQAMTFGVRGGKLVLLAIYDENRRADDVDDRKFKHPPLLAGFKTELVDHVGFEVTTLALP